MSGLPAKRFRCSSSLVKFVSLLMVKGSFPPSWFCPNLSFFKVDKFPIPSGKPPRSPSREQSSQIMKRC